MVKLTTITVHYENMAQKSTHNQENILDEFIDIDAAYTGSAMNFDLRATICKEKRKWRLFEFKSA